LPVEEIRKKGKGGGQKKEDRSKSNRHLRSASRSMLQPARTAREKGEEKGGEKTVCLGASCREPGEEKKERVKRVVAAIAGRCGQLPLFGGMGGEKKDSEKGKKEKKPCS